MPVHGAQRAAGERFADFTYESTPLVYSIIAAKARREFSRAMRFEEGGNPRVPPSGGSTARFRSTSTSPSANASAPTAPLTASFFQEELCRAYFRALWKELRCTASWVMLSEALYVGGGTPTVLIDELVVPSPSHGRAFPVGELSVETNPNHLTGDRRQPSGGRKPSLRRRPELRRRPAQTDRAVPQVRKRRGDRRKAPPPRPGVRYAQRGHDL